MLHSQVVQNTTQPMRRLELEAPTGHGHTNVLPCLASLGLQKSRWRLVLAGPAFRAPIILEPFNAIPKSRYCRTMALACTWYFSAFAHSPAQAAVVVRQEQSTKSFAVSSAMICGSEAGGQNYRRIKGCGSVAAVFFPVVFFAIFPDPFFQILGARVASQPCGFARQKRSV